jgi:CRP-like cAMP-binding protein
MSIEDDIAFFERVPTFTVLGRAALRILAIGAESRYVHSGEVLFHAGDPADSGFVVQEGGFILTSQQPDGSDAIAVGRGTLLGELALLTETMRPVTATASEPSTVLRIPRTLFLKMLEGYPDAARKLRDVIASRADQSTREVYGVRTVLDDNARR